MKLKVLKRQILLLFIVFSIGEAIAQDIQLSQFYALPTFLSPAFVGSSHHNRASVHSRVQWPKLDAQYISYLASIDKYFSGYNSGFGVVVLHDRAGSAAVSQTGGIFQYSYEINVSRKITVRAGLQGGYLRRSGDFDGLNFPSQFDEDPDVFDFTGNQPISGANKNYWDFGSGALVYTKQLWFGYNVDHLNRPNTTLVNGDTKWPMKHVIVGGYKIWLKKPSKLSFEQHPKDYSITPTFYYKSQGKSDQFDVGVYLRWDHLLAGVWYRGIPFKKYAENLQNNESVAFHAGWRYHQYTIYYSYDKVVSLLDPIGSGGAHEINLTYVGYRKWKKQKPMKRIPCPNLYKH